MANYNINAVTRRVVYTGSAGVGPYAFSFEILVQTDVAVYFNATLLTLTTDYTVTINANGTGSVTLVTGTNVPTTPTASDQIAIVGARDIERTTDFVTAGELRAAALNEQLDGLTIFDQQLLELTDRALTAPITDPISINMTLPTRDSRKGKYLAFNATTGDPEPGAGNDDITALAAITDDIARLADIEDGTLATDAIQTTASNSSNITTVAGNISNVNTVAGNNTNISSVASNATNINTVAGDTTQINAVAGNATNINAVASNATNINSVAGNATNINTVAGDTTEINAVASNASNINTVAGSITNVNNVGGSITNVNTVATNIADVNNFADVYRIGSTDPTTSLDTGDLFFNTTSSSLKVYDGAAWTAGVTAGSGFLPTTGGSLTGNVTFTDNTKAFFGTGSDLEVFHNGSNSIINDAGTGELQIQVGGSTKLSTSSTGVDVTGDLTVDTNTLYIDSTNNRVGVGTASPSVNAEIRGSASNGQMRLGGSTTATYASFYSDNDGVLVLGADAGNNAASSYLGFEVDGTERARITSDGNLGIGTALPEAKVHIYESDVRAPSADADDLVIEKTGDTGLSILSTTTGRIYFGDAAGDDQGSIRYVHSDDSMRFETGSSEAARFDASRNLLVGKTATASVALDVPGHTLYASGTARHIVSGGEVMNIIRQTSDGNIIGIYKDATHVAAIGVLFNDNPYFSGAQSGHCGITFEGAEIVPMSAVNRTDNYVDIGNSTYRYDDIYATNGTIQTSDANEKQQIASLTDAEITAAKAISKLFKTFKWNDKVEAKGDAARTHTGVIAQEVEQAMTDAGLDAGNYAFFISSTWWETQTEVPAVEAVDEVVDEDGNVVTESVEAQEAYTRTDTYKTAEEAPAGAVERTRLGIRYPELLSFIGAATEQRLASIEARLDALEATE